MPNFIKNVKKLLLQFLNKMVVNEIGIATCTESQWKLI